MNPEITLAASREVSTTQELSWLNFNTPATLRTPEETSKLQRVIATLFTLSSRQSGFQLLPHPQEWACGFSPATQERIERSLKDGSFNLERMSDKEFTPDAFYYPLEKLRTLPEQEIFGVTHHESAHAQYTSFRLLLLGHKQAQQEGKLATTFGLLLNGVEDGRINRLKSDESDTIREQLATYWNSWEKRVVPNISTQSLVRQYSLNAVHCWLRDSPIPEGLDTRVQAAFEVTREAVFRYINENDRQKSFTIFREEIWPAVKHLEDEARNDQALSDFRSSRNKSEPNDQVAPPDEREQLKNEFRRLPQDQQDNFNNAARSQLDQRQAEEANQDGIKGFSYQRDEASGNYTLTQHPVTNEADRANAEKLIGAAYEAENQRRAAQLEKEKKAASMRRNGFQGNQEGLFDEFCSLRNSIINQKNKLVALLEEILPRDSKRVFGGEYHSGTRVDLGKLAKRAPLGDSRFHQRRSTEMLGDPLLYVEIDVDNTISMRGEKILEAKRATLLALEVLSDLKLPTCAKRFASDFEWIQTREQLYTDPGARVKPNVLAHLDASGGSTNIGAALLETKTSLAAFKIRNPKTTCLVVVLSDGDANTGLIGADLVRLVKEIQRQAIVININLSGSQSDIQKSKEYFGDHNVVDCASADELPRALVRVLRAAFEKAANKVGR